MNGAADLWVACSTSRYLCPGVGYGLGGRGGGGGGGAVIQSDAIGPSSLSCNTHARHAYWGGVGGRGGGGGGGGGVGAVTPSGAIGPSSSSYNTHARMRWRKKPTII